MVFSVYWMAGLSPAAANFFKYLLILVLYSLAMTLYNFLLGTLFENGGVAILLSALSALYQMTFAGFFVHLSDIPPVLRWLQWLCPLKYTLEALSVNEVGSGLMIEDTLQGVPVNVSASLIMQLVSFSAHFILPIIDIYIAIRIWRGQLLPRCSCYRRIYTGVWFWCHWDCLAQGSRTEVTRIRNG